jgi:hypothetical protein
MAFRTFVGICKHETAISGCEGGSENLRRSRKGPKSPISSEPLPVSANLIETS